VQLFLRGGGKRGMRRGGSTVPEADGISKSGAVVVEAEDDDWCLEVKYDQRKSDRWAESTVGPNYWLGQRKKYGWEYEMWQKDRRKNTDGTKQKKKKRK
jgi:hypothetical protein